MYRRNKYNNKRKKCNQDWHSLHDSMIEAAYCDQIHLEMDKAEDTGIAEIQKEKSYPLRDIDGNALGRIMPDFTVTMKDGTIEIREVKGFFTAEWKWKWALMRYQYTEFVYKVITEADLW